MTAQLATLGSQCSGHCTGHSHGGQNWTGTLTTNPTNSYVTCGGTELALVGSSGVASCGHTFTVINGAGPEYTAQGVQIAIVGSDCPTSPGGSTGKIITGYANGTVG